MFSFHYYGMIVSYGMITGLPSSVCMVDCAINGFIDDQIKPSKGNALGF